MKHFIFFIFAFLLFQTLVAQPKWSVEGSFGLNANFFVNAYQEYGPIPNSVYLYKKDAIGTASGVELKFRSGKKSAFFIGYNRTLNSAVKNLSETRNGVAIEVVNFTIRHIDDFFIAGYERSLGKKWKNWKINAGLGLVYYNQQEITLEQDIFIVQERDFKYFRLVEACVLGGVEYGQMIDKKFELGFRVRAFYVFSGGWMESITATPVLRYHF